MDIYLSHPEFLKEEYKAAKVDPIAQFSKPVAVGSYNLFHFFYLVIYDYLLPSIF